MGVVIPFNRLWLFDVGCHVTYAVRAKDETAARLQLSVSHPHLRACDVTRARAWLAGPLRSV